MTIVVGLMALAMPLLAESDFSGTWTLNPSKSEYGQFPAPDLMMRTVAYRDGVLKMSTLQSGTQGEVRSELQYTTDGEVSVNGENRGAAHWEGDTLVIESSRTIQNAELTSREVWTLSDDGAELTIETHIMLPQQGGFDVKQVFEKAPSL